MSPQRPRQCKEHAHKLRWRQAPFAIPSGHIFPVRSQNFVHWFWEFGRAAWQPGRDTNASLFVRPSFLLAVLAVAVSLVTGANL